MPEACLSVRTFDRLLLVRENENPPRDVDWEKFLRVVTSLIPRIEQVRAIVMSDGGAPTAEQRKGLSIVMARRDIQTAVISDKGAVRFVVATIGLFNKSIRTYSSEDSFLAYNWLRLTGDEQRSAIAALNEMSREVGSSVLLGGGRDSGRVSGPA